jgi:polyhydroxyalkanoate synthesis regulator protein
MLVAVVVLMLITSMGIFGFLSKAHTEQSVPVGDNQAKIEIIDERIAIEQEVIEQARRDLTILNQQVERFSELGAVTRGVNVRNQQREERDALNAQIAEAQTKISVL